MSIFWWNTFTGTSSLTGLPKAQETQSDIAWDLLLLPHFHLRHPVHHWVLHTCCSLCLRCLSFNLKTLCSPLRSSSNVTSFIKSFLSVSRVPFKVPRALHSYRYFLNIYFVVLELFVYIYVFSKRLWTSWSRHCISFTFVSSISSTSTVPSSSVSVQQMAQWGNSAPFKPKVLHNGDARYLLYYSN